MGRGIWETDLIIDDENDMVLNFTMIGTQTWSGNSITSSSRIIANSDIQYNSASDIVLNPGFAIEKGSTINCYTGQ